MAGAIAAAGPLVIHLLNRRRFRTVKWAAMDFLREAVQRNRRILEIRDLLLLALRTLAVLLFGLALARPFFSNSAGSLEDRQPLHAILMLDNSRSMSYESLGGSLLDRAKLQARQYLEKLPAGSRATIIPGCGHSAAISHEPYANLEAAAEAIGKIEIDDRPLSQLRVVNVAQEAQQTLPGLAKRLVFWGDQQRQNWRGLDTPEAFHALPAMQLVNIAPESNDNTCCGNGTLPNACTARLRSSTFHCSVASSRKKPWPRDW